MKKEKNKKGIWYLLSSILLTLCGLAGFSSYNTNGFTYWNAIFLILGIIGIVKYILSRKKGK